MLIRARCLRPTGVTAAMSLPALLEEGQDRQMAGRVDECSEAREYLNERRFGTCMRHAKTVGFFLVNSFLHRSLSPPTIPPLSVSPVDCKVDLLEAKGMQ